MKRQGCTLPLVHVFDKNTAETTSLLDSCVCERRLPVTIATRWLLKKTLRGHLMNVQPPEALRTRMQKMFWQVLIKHWW